MRGPSAVTFGQDKSLSITQIHSEFGPLNIQYKSRWLRRSEAVTIPGQLWVEIKGHGPSLEEVLPAFANAGLSLLPILAVSANAAISDLDFELAFETTPGKKKREYFQSFLSAETNTARKSRRVDTDAALKIVDAVSRHPDSERISRAIEQYRIALKSWRFGYSTLAVAHLWMAVEALTKVFIRAECKARQIEHPKELADAIGVDKANLDKTIRRDRILYGDQECYDRARKASDGFEHGYIGFDELQSESREIRTRLAQHVRGAILELLDIDAETKERLMKKPFSKPMGHWPLVKYLRGTLVSDGDNLAPPGYSYPSMEWKTTIKSCVTNKNGDLDIEFDESFTASLADGVEFQLGSMEIWEPN